MSVELKLTAANKTEQRILDYLLANASDVLAEKINAGKKTIKGAMAYCQDEARKLNKSGSGSCVCVEDETVFGWVIHYFEETELDEEEIPEEPKPKKEVQLPAGVKQAKPAKQKPRKVVRKPGGGWEDAPEAEAQPVEATKPEKPVTPPDPQLSLFDALMGGGKA